MPGVALRGETCGAVTGALMLLGLAFGREKPDDFQALQLTLSASRKLCRLFEAEFGGCMCRDVQQRLFGKSFNLADPAEVKEFAGAGAMQKCRLPSGRAARIAGEMIIDMRGKS